MGDSSNLLDQLILLTFLPASTRLNFKPESWRSHVRPVSNGGPVAVIGRAFRQYIFERRNSGETDEKLVQYVLKVDPWEFGKKRNYLDPNDWMPDQNLPGIGPAKWKEYFAALKHVFLAEEMVRPRIKDLKLKALRGEPVQLPPLESSDIAIIDFPENSGAGLQASGEQSQSQARHASESQPARFKSWEQSLSAEIREMKPYLDKFDLYRRLPDVAENLYQDLKGGIEQRQNCIRDGEILFEKYGSEGGVPEEQLKAWEMNVFDIQYHSDGSPTYYIRWKLIRAQIDHICGEDFLECI